MPWESLQRIRADAPLVHNITNYVVMNSTANALLAVGASPVMAHAIEEVEEMVALAQALVINLGTLSAEWVGAMRKAGAEAARRKIPLVLDPVGCGATRFRTATAKALAQELHPAIIRGNASEILALSGAGGGARGVDSRHSPEAILEEARALSRELDCVLSISGPADLVVRGERAVGIENGHPMMAKVTGMGCTASALTGAFAAVAVSAFDAAVNAMTVMGVAGEMAAERSSGPGSLQMHFLDVLYGLRDSDLAQRGRLRNIS